MLYHKISHKSCAYTNKKIRVSYSSNSQIIATMTKKVYKHVLAKIFYFHSQLLDKFNKFCFAQQRSLELAKRQKVKFIYSIVFRFKKIWHRFLLYARISQSNQSREQSSLLRMVNSCEEPNSALKFL